MLQRSSPLAVCGLLLSFFCLSCASRQKSATPQAGQADAETSSAVPTVLPLGGIPRVTRRRYVNFDGGEAFAYAFGDRNYVLTKGSGAGDFQNGTFSSIADPIILPLPNGEAVISSPDQLMIRHVCYASPFCTYDEVIKAPTSETPLGLEAELNGYGGRPSRILMVNGSPTVYSMNLLERTWSVAGTLPNGVQAVSIKQIGGTLLVLDKQSKQLWVKSEAESAWRSFAIATEDVPQQLVILGGNVVIASPTKIKFTSLSPLVRPQTSGYPGVSWTDLPLPESNTIIQLSNDFTRLFCTTSLGNTYQLNSSYLERGREGLRWSPFITEGRLPVEYEQIQNARTSNGKILVFTLGGIVHSTTNGSIWKTESTGGSSQFHLDQLDEGDQGYSITRDTFLERTGGNGKWNPITPLSKACSSAGSQGVDLIEGDHLLNIDENSFLVVLVSKVDGTKSGCIYDRKRKSFEYLSAGWDGGGQSLKFLVIQGHLLAISQTGIQLWQADTHHWLTPSQESNRDATVPTNIAAATPYGSKEILVATAAGNLYHAEVGTTSVSQWVQQQDNQKTLVKNLISSGGRIVDLWVNPKRLKEIYLLVNQGGNSQLYSRDKTDSFFLFADQQPDPPLSFLRDDEGNLYSVGTAKLNRIIPNRPVAGTFDDLLERCWEKLQEWAKEPVSWISGFVGSYLIAVLCILLLRYFPKNPVFGRAWLASFLIKPFTILPWSGRWLLFLGYRKRLLRTVESTGPYFGLAATLPSGAAVSPDSTGAALMQAVLDHVSTRQPLLVTGRPGAGKSILLGRLAMELAKPGINWLPILVTSDDYEGDLIKAASKVLAERFGIPFDKEDMLVAQMQVGGIAILFDGLSEVSTSRAAAVADLQRVTRMPEFSKCCLIVGSRPFRGTPSFSETKILPVSALEAIKYYLSLFNLEASTSERVERNLFAFGDQPIDVQLLSMTIEASQADTTEQRHVVFAAFFKKRLNAEGTESTERWEGLRLALELMAKDFSIDTGLKSVGLSPRVLVDLIEVADPSNDMELGGKALLEELRNVYSVDYSNAVAFLDYLKNAGILSRIERWKFAHDTFEEYFCAAYLLRRLSSTGTLPDLTPWLSHPQDFREVFSFLNEMADDPSRELLKAKNLPASWQWESIQIPN